MMRCPGFTQISPPTFSGGTTASFILTTSPSAFAGLRRMIFGIFSRSSCIRLRALFARSKRRTRGPPAVSATSLKSASASIQSPAFSAHPAESMRVSSRLSAATDACP